jgi:EAL domain-containing protein (putative c-di-GMP-specific phosphodiesterase class I)
VLQLAKHACLRAKETGGNQLALVDTASGSRRRKLRRGLRTNRLRLLIQTPAALGPDDPPAHAEVLLRVADKAGRLGSPAGFLASADHAELGAQIDRWVIAQVAAQDARRRPDDAAPAGYSINLSAQGVLDPELLPFIVEQCRRHDLAPQRLGFELDEALALAEPDALAFARALRAAGFMVALDDCGINGRNLAELHDVPADYLKISGSLVRALAEDPVDDVLVDAINRIAHLSGKRTVGKCVEDAAALQRVRDLKLDYAQGFAVAEPVRLC